MPTTTDTPLRPVLGVSCALVASGCVLMIQRGKPPYEGIWSLPGGSVELGETIFAAAAREVGEETGVGCLAHSLLTVLDVIERVDGSAVPVFHYAIVCVRASLHPAGQALADDPALPVPTAASDARSAAWFRLPSHDGPTPAGAHDGLDALELTPRMAQVLGALSA